MRKSTLIFDFDGTIADTHQKLVQISNRLAPVFGYKTIAPDQVADLMDRTTRDVIRILEVPVLKIPAIIARAKKEFQKDMKSLGPIPGIREALSQLEDVGIRMGILSSNSRDNVQGFLEHHNLTAFAFIQTTLMVWSKHQSLKKLIKFHGLEKNCVIYVGDEIRDIVAAQKMGLRIIAVAWGYNSRKALSKLKPDFLIDHPRELPGCVDKTLYRE